VSFRLFRFVSKQFCLFRLFRYGSETPKRTETNRKNSLLVSRNKPKINRNRLSFGLFRFEPKIYFICFEDTLGGPLCKDENLRLLIPFKVNKNLTLIIQCMTQDVLNVIRSKTIIFSLFSLFFLNDRQLIST
jgi:hypothetical protein